MRPSVPLQAQSLVDQVRSRLLLMMMLGLSPSATATAEFAIPRSIRAASPSQSRAQRLHLPARLRV